MLPAWGLAAELVLSKDRLGPLPIGPETTTSVRELERLFPQFRVTQSVAQTDGADEVVLAVADQSGQPLFEVRSEARYADRDARRIRNAEALPIKRVEVSSPTIVDRYGLRVGMRYRDIVARRGEKLEFGQNHHDVFLGGDGVYYNLAPPPARDGPDPEPSRANMIRGDWRIVTISVPGSRW
ncbi:MAG: hypothetical protein KIT18_07390 [Burkholderiales bacterium]|nr:hypothetical protein [Burkholderiales bacterium]